MQTREAKCEQCGEVFLSKYRSKRDGWARYCSRKCVGTSQRRGETRKCKHCGEEFYVPAARIRRKDRGEQGTFCSLECKAEWQKQFVGELNLNWRGGKFIRNDGYVAINVDGEYRLEHTPSLLNKLSEGGLDQTRMSITLTELEQITGLKIWNSLLYQNMLKNIETLSHTALKPAAEIWVLCRKPISEKTIAENVMKWGTGGLNIDGCRIGTEEIKTYGKRKGQGVSLEWSKYTSPEGYEGGIHQGRFPANVILDEEAGKMLDGQSGIKKGNGKQTVSFHKPSKNNCMSGDNLGHTTIANIGDSGGASRFFYCAKASKKERGDSKHPTVKPLSLMRYLCRLITPPEGIVLDPFAGSGTTLEAAILEGFNVVGIEKEHDYIPDIRRRIERAQLNTQALDMGLF